jgi:hypothetical protein
MKTYEGVEEHFHSLTNGTKWLVRFTPRPSEPQEKSPSKFGYGEEKTQALPACSFVCTQSELP